MALFRRAFAILAVTSPTQVAIAVPPLHEVKLFHEEGKLTDDAVDQWVEWDLGFWLA